MDPVRASLNRRLRALRRGTLDLVAHAVALVRYSMPDAQPRRHGVVLQRNIAYGPSRGACHKLDAYVPAGATSPLPVVMYVHGGGFSMLSKETHRVMALAIARRGYLVFNVNYRLGPRHAYPAPLEDAAAALLWVATNCARFGGDPARIALAGDSAGGNLVTALTVMACYPRPEPFARRVFDASIRLAATLPTYPFLDMTASVGDSPLTRDFAFDAVASYVGEDIDSATRKAPLASPLLILEGRELPARPLPPFFASCGTNDPLLAQTHRLKRALDRLGTPCELHVSPGEVHGYDVFVWRPLAKKKWRATHQFLAREMQTIPGVSDHARARSGG